MNKLLSSSAVCCRSAPPRRKRSRRSPVALHDFLYKRATALAQLYSVLHGGPAKSAKSGSATAQLEEAIGLFDRVLVMNPQNWAAAWLAGKAARVSGSSSRLTTTSPARSRCRKNPDVARELMLTCLDTRRAQEAIAVAEHALRLTPADAGLMANLALARLCSADVAGAEAAIDAALQADPRDEISLTLQRLIGEVRRGERRQPQTPADLER